MCVSQVYSTIYLEFEPKRESILVLPLAAKMEEDKGGNKEDNKEVRAEEDNAEVAVEGSFDGRDLEVGGKVVDNMADCNRVGDQAGGGQIEVGGQDSLVVVQVYRRIHGHCPNGDHFHNDHDLVDVHDFHCHRGFYNHFCFHDLCGFQGYRGFQAHYHFRVRCDHFDPHCNLYDRLHERNC